MAEGMFKIPVKQEPQAAREVTADGGINGLGSTRTSVSRPAALLPGEPRGSCTKGGLLRAWTMSFTGKGPVQQEVTRQERVL